MLDVVFLAETRFVFAISSSPVAVMLPVNVSVLLSEVIVSFPYVPAFGSFIAPFMSASSRSFTVYAASLAFAVSIAVITSVQRA